MKIKTTYLIAGFFYPTRAYVFTDGTVKLKYPTSEKTFPSLKNFCDEYERIFKKKIKLEKELD